MFNQQRLLTHPELALLRHMLRSKPSAAQLLAILASSRVEEMSDGGMGSLLFVSGKPNRKLGEVVAEFQFDDEDGIRVLASINLDEDGELFELDMWKVDFSPLKQLPPF